MIFKKLLNDLSETAENIDVSGEVRNVLSDSINKILSDTSLLKTAEEYYNLMFSSGKSFGREIGEWTDKESDEKLGWNMIFTVLFFARALELNSMNIYEYNGKPIDFFKTVIRHLDGNFKKFGEYGMGTSFKYWAYVYLQPRAFELGRLAFEIVDFSYDYEVYRSRITGEVIPFSKSNIAYDSNGLPDIDGHFITTFEKTDTEITGYTFSENGRLIFEPVSLKDYEPVLTQGDKAISLHIPGNDKLTEEAVNESLAIGDKFFERFFPDVKFKAYVCSSWLMDTALSNFLGENSNILKFQKRFRIVMAGKNDYSLFTNVFSVADPCPLEELVPTNRFQEEILNVVKSGGSLYTGRGYILK